MTSFQHIFQPIQIGPLTVRNRIEVSPAEPMLCTRDGLVTDEFVAFTAAMARGGAGIVTVGDSPINQAYADENHFVVNLADPFVVHGLFKVAEVIHRYGAVASIELNLRAEYLPADLTKEEVRGLIKDFADAAERCKKAGFDMVMLHGGHGHTVSQFYSTFFNKRTDEYGADTMENRCRFALELIDAVRERIGPEMAIEWRISGDELLKAPEGMGLEEQLAFAKMIQDKIDLIHVSAGNMYDVRTIDYIIQPYYMPRPTNVHLAAAFKKALHIPVTSVGSFTIELAEEAIAQGKADMVAMIRPFIADPELVNKARAGKADEIRPCLRCNQCTGDDPHGCPKPLRCSVNAMAGRELEFEGRGKAEVSKKVVIVGGGCAGMEAARRLAELGHRPVLFEKEAALGGTLLDAGANPLKSDVARYAAWSVRMTERTPGIDLRLGTEATPELIRAEHPDAVFLCVGSSQIVPPVPGIDGENVCLAVEVDRGEKKPGKRVVLVGAGLTGSETAVTLAREGHEVTVIDMLSMEAVERKDKAISRVHRLAQAAGVGFRGGLRLKAVTAEGVLAEDGEGRELSLPCDTVVLSLGVRPRKEALEALSGLEEKTVLLGDCHSRAGNITSAVREAFYAAMDV